MSLSTFINRFFGTINSGDEFKKKCWKHYAGQVTVERNIVNIFSQKPFIRTKRKRKQVKVPEKVVGGVYWTTVISLIRRGLSCHVNKLPSSSVTRPTLAIG